MTTQEKMKVMQFPSKYVQGRNAIELLPQYVEQMGGKSLIIVTRSQKALISSIMGKQSQIEVFNGECSYEEISRIKTMAEDMEATVIVAVGGGKTIDVVKISADQLDIPSIIVPTICATDAPTSGCAVTYTTEGEYIKVEYQKTNPRLVLIDSEIIARAPTRFLVSGMGDAFATYLEAIACEATASPNECKGGGMRTKSAMALSKLCTETLFEYGVQAKKDNEQSMASEALENIIEANTLLSGMGFESTGLGMCHAVANAFTLLPECHGKYHGEKVAFGCLVELEMYDPMGIKDKTYEFFKQVGLPVCLKDMDLPAATPEQIMLLANDVAKEDPSQFSHHEPYPFDSQKIADAIMAVDLRYGRQ